LGSKKTIFAGEIFNQITWNSPIFSGEDPDDFSGEHHKKQLMSMLKIMW
jgi:hypothetical protein